MHRWARTERDSYRSQNRAMAGSSTAGEALDMCWSRAHVQKDRLASNQGSVDNTPVEGDTSAHAALQTDSAASAATSAALLLKGC